MKRGAQFITVYVLNKHFTNIFGDVNHISAQQKSFRGANFEVCLPSYLNSF